MIVDTTAVFNVGTAAATALVEAKDAVRSIEDAMSKSSDGGKKITGAEIRTIARETGVAIGALGKLMVAISVAQLIPKKKD